MLHGLPANSRDATTFLSLLLAWTGRNSSPTEDHHWPPRVSEVGPIAGCVRENLYPDPLRTLCLREGSNAKGSAEAAGRAVRRKRQRCTVIGCVANGVAGPGSAMVLADHEIKIIEI